MHAPTAIIRTTLSKQPALGNCAAITHGRRIHAALAWLMIAFAIEKFASGGLALRKPRAA